jgi:glc operon protein GlcG
VGPGFAAPERSSQQGRDRNGSRRHPFEPRHDHHRGPRYTYREEDIMLKAIVGISSVLAVALFTTLASAQQAPTYGPEITLDAAKKIAAAAVAEAKENQWNVAIAIVDNHGFLVYYERLDDIQTASPNIALEKARTAAMFRRPSKALEDVIGEGRVAVLGLPGATPITGELPIVSGGKIIGGIGVSGVTSEQDEQVARAGPTD